MWRLVDRNVRSGLVIAWRLATSPTRTSPALEKATTDGVVREPSALGMTTGSPASSTATTELVVPRSIPTALGMEFISWIRSARGAELVRGRIKCRQRPLMPPTGQSEKLSEIHSTSSSGLVEYGPARGIGTAEILIKGVGDGLVQQEEERRSGEDRGQGHARQP